MTMAKVQLILITIFLEYLISKICLFGLFILKMMIW